VNGCGLTPEEVKDAAQRLDALSEEAIAFAAAAPDAAWGLGDDERVALALYIDARVNRLRA
jgi:hypothetical protein